MRFCRFIRGRALRASIRVAAAHSYLRDVGISGDTILNSQPAPVNSINPDNPFGVSSSKLLYQEGKGRQSPEWSFILQVKVLLHLARKSITPKGLAGKKLA
jgi:hypothetical protein